MTIINEQINISQWFPPNDEIATAVARLCILREDFYLAGLGMAAERIPTLDENGVLWRRLYFFRHLTVTLMEAKSALMPLQQNKEFQDAMEAEGFRKEVRAFERNLNLPELRALRNDLGGHVQCDAVRSALRRMDASVEGSMQVGTTHRDTHFGFVNNIVDVMLNSEGSEPLNNLKALEKLDSDLLSAIDRVVSAYAEMRKLI